MGGRGDLKQQTKQYIDKKQETIKICAQVSYMTRSTIFGMKLEVPLHFLKKKKVTKGN